MICTASVATLTAVSLANTLAMELNTTCGWFRRRCLVGEQARCLNLRHHIGKHMLHHLMLHNRATTLDPEEAMLARQLKSATGNPHGDRCPLTTTVGAEVL